MITALAGLALAGCARATPAPVTAPAPSAPPVEPSPAPVAAPAAHTLCDPTGTWQISVASGRSSLDDDHDDPFCGNVPGETFELALGFVRQDGATVLAGAVRPVGVAGQLGALLPGMRVALVPDQLFIPDLMPRCAVWLRAASGPGSRYPHLDLVLEASLAHPVDRDKLFGLATRWKFTDARDCSFTVMGKRIAADPAAWAALGEPAPPLPGPTATPVDDALAAAVARMDARSLLGDMVPDVSIVDYVVATVGQREDVTLLAVPCTTPGRRCVAIVGDPCRAHPDMDGCEGMYLTVVVDPERGMLDRALAQGYPVESPAEIEAWLAIAP